MPTISELLDKIKNAKYGRDVREAIHDGIRCCYDEGKAGVTDVSAREAIDTISTKIEKGLINPAVAPYPDVDFLVRIVSQRLKQMIPESTRSEFVVFESAAFSFGRLDISYGMDMSGRHSAIVTFISGDGDVLRMTGSAAKGATVAEMTFTEWEWENPPLSSVGEEYRTTERYMSYPVYTQLLRVYGSSIPTTANGNIVTNFEVDSLVQVVSLSSMYYRLTYGADDRVSMHTSVPTCDADLSIEAYGSVSKNANSGFMGGLSVKALKDITLLSEEDYIDVVIKYIKT